MAQKWDTSFDSWNFHSSNSCASDTGKSRAARKHPRMAQKTSVTFFNTAKERYCYVCYPGNDGSTRTVALKRNAQRQVT